MTKNIAFTTGRYSSHSASATRMYRCVLGMGEFLSAVRDSNDFYLRTAARRPSTVPHGPPPRGYPELDPTNRRPGNRPRFISEVSAGSQHGLVSLNHAWLERFSVSHIGWAVVHKQASQSMDSNEVVPGSSETASSLSLGPMDVFGYWGWSCTPAHTSSRSSETSTARGRSHHSGSPYCEDPLRRVRIQRGLRRVGAGALTTPPA